MRVKWEEECKTSNTQSGALNTCHFFLSKSLGTGAWESVSNM